MATVLSEEEVKDIEKAVQGEPTPQECEEYFLSSDNESKTIAITPAVRGAILRLDKAKALVLAAIIQDCARKL